MYSMLLKCNQRQTSLRQMFSRFTWYILSPSVQPLNRAIAKNPFHLSSTKSSNNELVNVPILPPAELCCQTGCHNCIYVQYADELVHYCNQSRCDPHLEVRKFTNSTSLLVMLDMLIDDAKNKLSYEEKNNRINENSPENFT